MATSFCSQCGNSLKDFAASRFCPHCGHVLNQFKKKSFQNDDQVLAFLQQGQFIQAIKKHRENTGVDLKQAKQEVEDLARLHQIPIRNSGRGCIVAAAILLAVIGIGVAIFVQSLTTHP